MQLRNVIQTASNTATSMQSKPVVAAVAGSTISPSSSFENVSDSVSRDAKSSIPVPRRCIQTAAPTKPTLKPPTLSKIKQEPEKESEICQPGSDLALDTDLYEALTEALDGQFDEGFDEVTQKNFDQNVDCDPGLTSYSPLMW